MDGPELIREKLSRKRIIYLLVTIIIISCTVGFIGFSSLRIFISNLLEAYLSFVESIANSLLNLSDSGVSILEHKVYFKGEVLYQHEWIANKTWVLALLILFWITPTTIRRRLIFSVLLLLVNFTGSILDVWLTSYFSSIAPDVYSAGLAGYTPHLLMILALLSSWIWRERKILLKAFSLIKINPDFLEKKLPAVILIVFIYALMSKFFLGIFQYTLWINFLFRSSAFILRLLNYTVYLDSHQLIGENGFIYMAKPCLGLNTMMLFAAIVYITGKNTWIKWIYIVSGVILLNIVNIVRFVLLFIHIQKHGDYTLSLDLHSMYRIVIYAIVFILWIYWFEKYSDIREKTRKVHDPGTRD